MNSPSDAAAPGPEAVRGLEDVRRAIIPGLEWGIWATDVLNNLPRVMAADGQFDHLELVGAWITADPGIRMVLRRLNDPADGLVGFTLTPEVPGGTGAGLVAELWRLIGRTRDLRSAGLAGEGTSDALGIRWLTGPADDLPWSDHVPERDDPVDREPAEMYLGVPIPGPRGTPADPAWAGDAQLAELFHRWRGTLWSTTQLTWYAVGRRNLPRMAIIACWATSPGTFQLVFHDSENGTDEDYRQASRSMLPPDQPRPRYGVTHYAGRYYCNNWETQFCEELDLYLIEDTHSLAPVAARNPKLYQWQDTIIWSGDWAVFAEPRRVPAAWIDTWRRTLDTRTDLVIADTGPDRGDVVDNPTNAEPIRDAQLVVGDSPVVFGEDGNWWTDSGEAGVLAGTASDVIQIPGPLGHTWRDRGGPGSGLGMPIADATVGTESGPWVAQQFRHGFLVWSEATGVYGEEWSTSAAAEPADRIGDQPPSPATLDRLRTEHRTGLH